MKSSSGIRSLAIKFPDTIRNNDYWRENFPHLLPKGRKRQRNIAAMAENDADIWSQAVAPYLCDPFRGAKERRILQSEESGLALECRAAKEAIALAELTPETIDLALTTSLFPDRPGPGHAAYLARAIGLHCPAWQIESTCASALVALETARTFIESGRYDNILIVVSHCGSNATDNADSLSWSLGDGAGALIVSSVRGEEGILGIAIAPTIETCDAYRYEFAHNGKGKTQTLARTGDNAIALAETAVEAARSCCQKAANAAGVSLADIDFFAFNTPTAWYADVCARALGIDGDRALNLYPRYGNIGPVFPLANLYHAAQSDSIRDGDLVLVYANGAAATAAAGVLRWQSARLGAMPAPPAHWTPEPEQLPTLSKEDYMRVSSLPIKAPFSREQIFTVEAGQRREILETYLLQLLSQLLQIPTAELESQQSLNYLLDSLVTLEAKRRIEADLQVWVPVEQFFQDNSIAELSDFLLNQLAIAQLMSRSPLESDREEKLKRQEEIVL
ncbi:MAG: 3-oxoacyl-[acyl-carrier-protein] synthase III C-terminal domain-containing protein, partial [Spirulina sp.]